MKSILKAAMAMGAIVVVQMILAYVLNYQIAEVFSKVSCALLFYYYIVKMISGKLNLVR